MTMLQIDEKNFINPSQIASVQFSSLGADVKLVNGNAIKVGASFAMSLKEWLLRDCQVLESKS